MKMQSIRQEDRGLFTLRLLQTKVGYSGVVIKRSGGRIALIEGTDLGDVWRQLEDAAAKAGKDYIGFDGAKARFRTFFEAGFDSPDYRREEREYKLRAKNKLDAAMPLETALHANGFGEVALTAFRDTNLLSPFEKMRVQDLLRGPSADRFIRAAARFTRSADSSALAEMAQLAKQHDCAKWTTVTYLPFLWRPNQHMFLKPEVTKDFAERVGHSFIHIYAPALEIAVYDRLLDLAARTEHAISDLHPQDRIDVQSFIWVVGAYPDADMPK